MTISSVYTADTYNGNGIVDTFPITFPFLGDADNILVSSKVIATGLITELTPSTDYNVVGTNVVLTTALPSTLQLLIQVNPNFLQETDYEENGPLPAETLERDLDKLTLELQLLKAADVNNLQLDPTVEGVNPVITASSVLANNADKYLRFNSDGTQFELVALTAGGGIDQVSDDPSPELGGNLDAQDFLIENVNALYTQDIFVADEMNITGDIITTGLIDGRDVAVDGTKLDTIEVNADLTDSDNVKVALDQMILSDIGSPAADDLILIRDVSATNQTKTVAVSALGGVTDSSTTTFTNKTIDADGTGNVITNIGSSEVKAELITGQTTVTAAVGDLILVSDVSDSNNLKKVTVQTIVDLAASTNAQKLVDTNGVDAVLVGTTASAVNEVTVTNAATLQSPKISATGDDSNITLSLQGKGASGYVSILDGADPTKVFRISVSSPTATTTDLVAFSSASRVISLPDASTTLVGTTDTATLTNKTLTSPVITSISNSGTITIPTGTYTLIGRTTTDILTNKTVTDCKETVATPTVTAGAVTISLANGTMQKVVTAANTTITLPSAVAGTSYTIIVQYGGTHTITWAGGGTLKWAGGSAPTATSVNGKYDIYVFVCHDATNTLASDGGRNF